MTYAGRILCIALCLGVLGAGTGLRADPPDIVAVRAERQGDGWRFDVTLRHPDTGWDHYADGWEVLTPDGARLGFRELVHPHAHEQPFTRSLTGVTIPDALRRVVIRARCRRDGWADITRTVDLPR